MTAIEAAANDIWHHLPPRQDGISRGPIVDFLLIDLIAGVIKQLMLNCGYVPMNDPEAAHAWLTEVYPWWRPFAEGRRRRLIDRAIERHYDERLAAKGVGLADVQATIRARIPTIPKGGMARLYAAAR